MGLIGPHNQYEYYCEYIRRIYKKKVWMGKSGKSLSVARVGPTKNIQKRKAKSNINKYCNYYCFCKKNYREIFFFFSIFEVGTVIRICFCRNLKKEERKERRKRVSKIVRLEISNFSSGEGIQTSFSVARREIWAFPSGPVAIFCIASTPREVYLLSSQVLTLSFYFFPGYVSVTKVQMRNWLDLRNWFGRHCG